MFWKRRTVEVLQISAEAYDELAARVQTFTQDGTIIMDGYGLTRGPSSEPPILNDPVAVHKSRVLSRKPKVQTDG